MIVLIFSTWINLATVSNLVDVKEHYSTRSWGCSVVMKDRTHVFVPHKKCLDVGHEMKKSYEKQSIKING